ncbi:MAG: response regulator transcription factor [Cytophagales bacterium]|nr:response regulator transcription factor [Cytophagales bacterium]
MNIYLIDNHPLMREALAIQARRIVATAKVLEAGGLAEFSAQAALNGPPDLIVTELNLPDSTGLGGISQIKTLYMHCPLVIFTTSSAALLEDACITAGADIFIEKTTPVNDIIASLRALVASDTTLDTRTGDSTKKLSKRQRQLMLMLNEGLSNREIAARMEISEHTVKVHLWRLFRKLGVNSRTQALHFGRNNWLV